MTTCRFCGRDDLPGVPFDDWVKSTFNDLDKLMPGDWVCNECLFFLDEHSDLLARRVGKDKPQRMRNYSHIIKLGEWTPYSKAQKRELLHALLEPPFPELAVIAESGQKHIVFRARRNPPGGVEGWVQFEEQTIWLHPPTLRFLVEIISRLMRSFSKSMIASGRYPMHLILRHGIKQWREDENWLATFRGKPTFGLAIFLSQQDSEGDYERTGD